ncbi:ATP-dependent DNA helicase [Buchananella felis]|uniref:ATP-dependent DNA helicase n=1 Tax=Buchananella felis TaxID=3231492 RepID=UPI003529BCFE
MSQDDAGPTQEELVLRVLSTAVAELGGTERAGQIQMASAVVDALARSAHLVVQAGTGTGKSLGYLAPVMTHAARSGEKAVVSTATLALQRQILLSDAPRVAQAVEETTGLQPKVAVLKGWQNYACLHKLGGGYPSEATLLDVGEGYAVSEAFGGATTELGEQVLRARDWAATSATGDRDDLVPGVSERAWAQVSTDTARCLKTACPVRTDCFAERARAQAFEADVIITNHAMLGVAASGNPRVLPEFSALVVDEAHELEGRVRSQNTVALSASAVTRVASTARRQAKAVVSPLEDAAGLLAAALMEVPDGRLIDGPDQVLALALTQVAAAARTVLAGIDKPNQASPDRAAALQLAATSLTELIDVAERATSDSVSAGRDVAYVERPRRGEDPPQLVISPIEVAADVANHLLEGRAAVLTSATLSLGGTFDAVAHRLGLNLASEPWEGLDVGSPFDYRKQGIIYVARHLPAPTRDGTALAASEEMVQLVRASGGGMLGLFTSRKAAEDAAAFLREHVDYPVYCQGEDQLPTLIERFKTEEESCLVGTLSLWQGVDVPGPACRLVVIDRIPFPRPTDPVIEALGDLAKAQRRSDFAAVSLPHAALLLAQGAGRLVRRSTDRGVVAVLDSRLATKGYGAFLRASLPDFWPTTDLGVVLGALGRLAGTDPSTR